MQFISISNVWSVQVSCLRITIFPQSDLCGPKWHLTSIKTIGVFLYSMWYTNISNIRFLQACFLKISFLTRFNNFTPFDPNWPYNFTKTIGFMTLVWYIYIYQIWDLSKLPFLSLQVERQTTYLHACTHATYIHARIRS